MWRWVHQKSLAYLWIRWKSRVHGKACFFLSCEVLSFAVSLKGDSSFSPCLKIHRCFFVFAGGPDAPSA